MSRPIVCASALIAAFVWAYWTTWQGLVERWQSSPDYGHGFLVLPIAIGVCWYRRDELSRLADGSWSWVGLVLILLGLATRAAAAAFYVQPLEGYSILLWVAGALCLLGGLPFMIGCLPAVAFLFFMVPLPYRLSLALRLPLQRIATAMSSWFLQCLGFPAFAEGNTILLNEHRLEVERACSGLRIFMGVFALVFAVVIASRRPRWEKALILSSALPIALLVNSLRIVGTGLCVFYATNEEQVQLSHDVAGWLMTPVAALLVGLFVWYLGKLFVENEALDVRAALHRNRVPASSETGTQL